MAKDRKRELLLAADVLLVVRRSSTHPVEYAIVLLVARGGTWHVARTFDNAHSPEEHHEHRYVGYEKQPPIVTHGRINEAMHEVEVKLRGGWPDIVRSWDTSR